MSQVGNPTADGIPSRGRAGSWDLALSVFHQKSSSSSKIRDHRSVLRESHSVVSTTEGAETAFRWTRKDACEIIRFAQLGHHSLSRQCQWTIWDLWVRRSAPAKRVSFSVVWEGRRRRQIPYWGRSLRDRPSWRPYGEDGPPPCQLSCRAGLVRCSGLPVLSFGPARTTRWACPDESSGRPESALGLPACLDCSLEREGWD